MTVLKALFTKEDIGNIHKILGFSCLASFVYRLCNLGEDDGNFGSHSYGTPVFVLHHFVLHISSFIFSLPSKRIASGYRLWPEARLHAMIFSSRSLAFILLFYFEDLHQRNDASDKLPIAIHWMNLLIVLATCAGADSASSVQPYPSHTIRDLEFPPLWKWFFSTIQFVATATCVVGPRRYTYHLLFVCIIQVNAFLMTMRRKNLATHASLVTVYAGILIVGFAICVWDDRYSHCMHATAVLGITAAMIRFHFNINKYGIWLIVGLLVNLIRDTGFLKTNKWWVGGHAVSWTVAMVLGYRKTALTECSKK